MICRNIASHNNSLFMGHLFIKIKTGNKFIKHTDAEIFDSPDKALSYIDSALFIWIKHQITHFYNQRYHAYKHTSGELPVEIKQALELVDKKLVRSTSLFFFCRNMIQIKDSVQTLYAREGSEQARWNPVINQIIHTAQEYYTSFAHRNKELFQQYIGKNQDPNSNFKNTHNNEAKLSKTE